MANHYYMLLTSLPYLAGFDRAKRLPINEVRLRSRLELLEEEDAAFVLDIADHLVWQRQPVERTEAQVVAAHRRLAKKLSGYPRLRGLVSRRMEARTVVAAMRRRARGLGPPKMDEPWGTGRFLEQIVRQWEQPEFHLAGELRWVQKARRLLDEERSLELERLLMIRTWDDVDRIVDAAPYSFEAVVGYLFKWDILRRWLTYEERAAARRFDALVTEVIGERDELCA